MANPFVLSGTAAADRTLLIEVGLGLLLLLGGWLARRRRIGAHRALQTTIVVANLVLIFMVMVPSFTAQGVLSHAIAHPGRLYFTGALIHAVVGTIAVLLAVYVVLAAGTPFLPERFRFQNYRLWMRAALLTWWLALALGWTTYRVWYRPGADGAVAPAAASDVPDAPVVDLVDFKFLPDHLKIAAGTTVTWINKAGIHSVKSEQEPFESEPLATGQRYQHRFARAGKFLVYCPMHGEDTMAETIEVVAPSPP
jgi:plastocyanin/uncharacterized membrane protein YozB (DUF420 family)